LIFLIGCFKNDTKANKIWIYADKCR